MSAYKVAVLKFTWSDTQWIDDHPGTQLYSDEVINRLFLPLQQWWGIARYWQDCSFGTINLEGSQIFPWRKLNNLPTPTQANQYGRDQVLKQAVKQALDEGWPLNEFTGIVVWVNHVSPPQDAGGTGFQKDGRTWPAATLYEGWNLDFNAHEFGHVLGFKHTWGPGTSYRDANGTIVLYSDMAPYRDPYCVMAAQSYGGYPQPVFTVAPDPAGPPPGDAYWRQAPPMPAAATLFNEDPTFELSHHVWKLGTFNANWQRSVRIRARDLASGNSPALVVAFPETVVNRRFAYLVELRRSHGWDRGIGRIAPGQTVKSPPAIVIHSLQKLVEYPNEPIAENQLPKVCYEGKIALPMLGGDADWVSPSGDFVVRVDGVEDDLSWVELTLGGATLKRQSTVIGEFGVPDGVQSQVAEEGVAEQVPVFICGSGTYHYSVIHQYMRVKNTAYAYGYDSPRFNWKVNGEFIPPDTVTGTISIPVAAAFPGPTSETTRYQTAQVQYQVDRNLLWLTGRPEDGNYTLAVEAIATEVNSVINPAPPSSTVGYLKMVGVKIIWEDQYYQDVEQCVKRVAEINVHYAKSKRWPRFDTGGLRLKQEVLAAMYLDLQDVNPVLAKQLGRVISIYGQKQVE
ncbi:MAG: hypothetical protein HZC41_11905 [Chloroflexi bacterium]|nr:hypothetical protein [Chloroflexota bacterium]